MPPSTQGLRIGVIVAIVAVVGTVAYVWHKSADTNDSAPSSTVMTVPVPGRTAVPDKLSPVQVAQVAPTRPSLPDQPSLPTLPNGTPATTPAELFSVEARDPAWAAAIEAEIKDRTTSAPAKLTTECHAARCQLTFDGGTVAIGKTISLLESEKGLIGFADSLYLMNTETHDDGSMTIRAIATFPR